jgi:hypothetical protein
METLITEAVNPSPQIVDVILTSSPIEAAGEELPVYTFVDAVDTYLNYRNSSPQSYEHLVDGGRRLEFGETVNAHTPEYGDAMEIAYGAQRVVTFTTLRGFSNSSFANLDFALLFVRIMHDNNRDYEMALVMAELESTYGLGSSNYFGVCDPNYMGSGVSSIYGYCGYLDHYQMMWNGHICNDVECILKVYNESPDYWTNVSNLYWGLKGERY